MSQNNTMSLTLLDWRPMKKNSLRGFATVRLGKALKVADISVHCANGKRWASLPSKPQINKDGVVLREDSGKIKYTPIISWSEKESQDRFSEAVILAIEAAHPGDTQVD